MSIKSRLRSVEWKSGSSRKRYEGFRFQIIVSGRTREEVERKVQEEIERRRKMGIPADDPDVPKIVAIYCPGEAERQKEQRDPEAAA